jgi:hypothetical protein
MTKKFGLISGIEAQADSPKKKYQVFEAELGFEKVQVVVPFENADAFVSEAESVKPKSRSSLKRLAEKFGGELT